MRSPRGRPRGFDRDRALDDALTVFWRLGPSATTREVGTALGISPSSLYHAFGSKEDLLAEVLENYRRRLHDEVVLALRGPAPGLDAIDQFFARLGDWLVADGCRGCLISRVIAEGGRDGGSGHRVILRHGRSLRRALRSALEAATATDGLDAATVDHRVDVLVGMAHGLSFAALRSADGAAVRRLSRACRREIASWAPQGAVA